MQALLELDCIPAGMELFPASNDDQWTLIKRVIDDCDYYLLIVGGRYGSVNEKGISYTQMEFEYALETGKPIISFLPKEPEMIPAKYVEKGATGKKKLEEFKKLVQKKLVKYWSSPQDLGAIVSRSMIKLIKDFPAIGWVKSDNITDENSAKEIIRLQKENEDLKTKLKHVATRPPVGTESFCQGDDIIAVTFTFNGEDDEHQRYNCTSLLELSWDEIFMSIAPDLIDEARENEIRWNINKLITSYSDDIKKSRKFSNLKNLTTFSIDDEDYNTIKVQLKALGLIKLSEKKRSTRDNYTYWTLTEYGDYLLTQLLALRKDN